MKQNYDDSILSLSNVSTTCQSKVEELPLPPRSGFDYGYCGLLDYGTDIPLKGKFMVFVNVFGILQIPFIFYTFLVPL